jgi:hypothetical protein
MTKPAKEIWEQLTSKANEDEQVQKTNEELKKLDKALGESAFGEQDRGFRLPYSSIPKSMKGQWK